MKFDGSFKYFLDGESKTYEEICKLVNIDMSCEIKGLDVVYHSKKEIQIQEPSAKACNDILSGEPYVIKTGVGQYNVGNIIIDRTYVVTDDTPPNHEPCNLGNCLDNQIKSLTGETNVSDEKGNPLYFDSAGYMINIGEDNKFIPEGMKMYQMMGNVEGIKETNGKLDYSEVDLSILDLMAKRFNANKIKYPKGNMLKKIDKQDLTWAAFRHIKKMLQPIEKDPETFEEHLTAVLCNMQMIYQQMKNE